MLLGDIEMRCGRHWCIALESCRARKMRPTALRGSSTYVSSHWHNRCGCWVLRAGAAHAGAGRLAEARPMLPSGSLSCQLVLRLGRRVQLVDPTLRESINSQHLFQHLESCQPTHQRPGPGTWQPKRLKPSSRESLEVEILRTITSISAKLNEKTLITWVALPKCC